MPGHGDPPLLVLPLEATGASLRPGHPQAAGASTRFGVRRRGAPIGDFEVPLLGAHNVRNALAAIAVAADLGVSTERIAEGLERFAGVKRRLEIVGTADGVTVYDDFAHHPTGFT